MRLNYHEMRIRRFTNLYPVAKRDSGIVKWAVTLFFAYLMLQFLRGSSTRYLFSRFSKK